MAAQIRSLAPLPAALAPIARKLIGLVAVLMAPALVAAGCAWMEVGADPLALVSAVTLIGFSYTLDHALDRKLGRSVALWFGVAHLGIVIATLSAGRTAAALLLATLPLTILPYARPCFRVTIAGRTCRRVKDIPFVKPVYVAGSWAMFAPFAALSSTEPVSLLGVLLAASWIFGRVIVNITISDLRDVAADTADGVASWPVLLGEQRTRSLCQVVNGVFVIAAVAAAGLGLAPRAVLWLELVAVLNAVGLTLMAREGASRPLIADVLVDGGTPLLLLFGLTLG